MRNQFVIVGMGLLAAAAAGCGATLTTYTKPEAPWDVVHRVAVLPFNLPSENPVQRQLMTELFSQELRRATPLEVVEVPLQSAAGSGMVDPKQLAQEYQVDAIISGSLDDAQGMVLHVRVQDVSTQELLWSGSYLLGTRAEFFSLHTQQQQFQRSFRKLLARFSREVPLSAPEVSSGEPAG